MSQIQLLKKTPLKCFPGHSWLTDYIVDKHERD
ncbi:Uncharacterized protein APZ42_022313 [Daphnia magna]|uniref:Uncharacterized protein n=1 Tax=Daphnia magna TaxID=35525 RepID=A0A164VE66_9CRUS|nr:Uncharacterized protein APZ42_022313 [Daphnia magna]